MLRLRFSFWRRRQSTKVVLSLLAFLALLLFLRTDDDGTHHPTSTSDGGSSPHLVDNNGTTPLALAPRPRTQLLAGPKKLALGLATRWHASPTRPGPVFGLTEQELTVKGGWKGRETKFERGTPGFMLVSNLYLQDGVLYAVISDRSTMPDVSRLLSGVEEASGHIGPAKQDRYRMLSPEQANALFGTTGDGIARLAGTTFFFNDAGARGLFQHFFHFAVENVVGAWKVLASPPESITTGKLTDTPFPTRFMFPRTTEWKDKDGRNAWFLHTAFPSTSWEDQTTWDERAKSGNVYVFDQILIIDRGNYKREGGKNGPEAKKWNKMTADVLLLPSPPGWFDPVRHSAMKRLGISDDHIHRRHGHKVITYIDRQETPGSARLLPADHTALIDALQRIERDHQRYGNNIDVYVIKQETLDQRAVLQLLAKTDILLSVRTPQQSHQLWMKAGSALFEFFEPGHYTHDSEMLSAGLGHVHHVIHKGKLYHWQDEGPSYKQSNGGTQIPVDASFVVSQIDAYLATQGFSL